MNPASLVASPSAEPSAAAVPTLRVLVVDDEMPIRLVLTSFLRRRGHMAWEAAGGEEALHLMCQNDFDVIISDLRMPDLDGQHLLTRLQDRADGFERKMIFMTGDEGEPFADGVSAPTDIPVVLKPFSSLEHVVDLIEAHARMESPV